MLLLLAGASTSVLSTPVLAEERPRELSEDIGANAAWRRGVPIIDVHGHIGADAVEKTLAAMDANFISRIVNLTAGKNAEELARAKKVFDALGKGRFILYVNDPYLNFPVEDPGFGKKVAAVVEECVRLGARGLKVSKTLGLYWKDKAGKVVRIDDPRLEGMWEACARLDIPVSIHSGDPKAFWLPVDEKNERYDELRDHPNWAFGGGAFPPREEILRQLENVVARHPKVTFVGVHFGNDPEDPDHVAHLFRKHPNYNADVAARVPEIGRQDPAKLRKLFVEHQDRILFGTDFMVSPAGYILGAGPRLPSEAEVKKYFDAHWRFFETSARQVEHPTHIQGRWKIDCIDLPVEVLEKLYYKNAERIILKRSGPGEAGK
ncbi:MAG: amidohydrolase family protein [Planctomycetes bacterium]|nr:amidohydrolase family protein [Planctomycetota bacterium]